MRTRVAGKPSSFGRAVDLYLDVLHVRNYSHSYMHSARLVLDFFGQYLRSQGVRDIRRVSEVHVTRFAAYLPTYESQRFRVPLAVTTQRFYLGCVRGFFAYLEQAEVILRNPAADVELPRVHRLPRGVLTVAQAQKLVTTPNPWTAIGLRDRAMLEVFYGTGVRLSECLNLSLSDLDMQQGVLLVRNGKGRKDRVVPVPAQAAKALDRYLVDARPLLVRDPRISNLFLSSRGRRMSQSNLSSMLHGYGREAGIPWNVSPHALRHTCATHLIKGGADVRHVQKLLGHAELDNTAIYTRVAVKDLHEVMRKRHPREPKPKRKRKQ